MAKSAPRDKTGKSDTVAHLPDLKSDTGSLLVFDPDISANRIRSFLQAGLFCYWNAGEELAMAKAELEHGNFNAWVETDCGITPRTAQRHMRLYKTFSRGQVQALDGMGLRKMLALTEGSDGLEPAELKKMSAAELRTEVEKLMKAREIGQGQLEDLQADFELERAENEDLKKQVKRLGKLKFDSSKHEITRELARLAYEIEQLAEAAKSIDPKKESDVADGIMEHVVVLNSKLGAITRMFSVATRKRA